MLIISIKRLRIQAKLTQEDVAKALNIRQSTVSMWENGKNVPRSEMLPKIARLFDCTIDELFVG